MHPDIGIPPSLKNDSGHLLGGCTGVWCAPIFVKLCWLGWDICSHSKHATYTLCPVAKIQAEAMECEIRKKCLFWKCWKHLPLLKRSHVYENTQSIDSLHFIYQQCSSTSMEPCFYQFVFSQATDFDAEVAHFRTSSQFLWISHSETFSLVTDG